MKLKILCAFAILLSTCQAAAPQESSSPKAITSFSNLPQTHDSQSDLGSVPSPYYSVLKKVVKNWPKSDPFSKKDQGDTVEALAYVTPGNDYYIGAAQRMIVSAPFETVTKVVDNFTKYVEFFDGLIRAEGVSADGNLVTTSWENSIPVPFVANERNQMIYLVCSPKPGLRLYRYGLKESNHIKMSDGFILVERLSESKTRYTEIDFWDAGGGLASFAGSRKMWSESIEGLLQTDYAFKLASEHPEWSSKKVLEESKHLAEKSKIDSIIDKKYPASSLN